MAKQRVQKIIANAGYCSRRKAEELIAQGRVRVNKKTITLGDQADPDTDNITIDMKKLEIEDKRYILLHKPKGCECTVRSTTGKPTVMQYVMHVPERVFPVGRLDFNTTGALILTNDGDFANTVMHPRYEHTKTYVAFLDKLITKEAMQKLRDGVVLKDGKVHIDRVKKKGPRVLELTIHEGKNKVVKRLCKKLGYYVKELKRTHIGKVELGTIKPGQYRELTKKEISGFMQK